MSTLSADACMFRYINAMSVEQISYLAASCEPVAVALFAADVMCARC
jgi:hypothetical protein